MIATVSTVKDTLANVQRFVAGNLAGGADHLLIFLDDEVAEVGTWLAAHPDVTCVPAWGEWWQGDRPGNLNVRQRINANVARHLLGEAGWCEWLFHVDGDEVVQLDRAVLDDVPAEHGAVRLAPLEAVSRKSWDSEPTWFKRLLGEDDLTLLHVLGVIDRPANGAYFHGHVEGKCGVRPSRPDLWLTLHRPVGPDGEPVEAYAADGLRVLHYESTSGEEFVRKWTAMIEAGGPVRLRAARQPTAVAVRALLGRGLSAEEAAPYLERIFERMVEDDFDTLRDLRLLEHIDPLAGRHEPRRPTDAQRGELAAALAEVRERAKRDFHPPSGRERPAADTGGAKRWLRRS